MNLQKNTTETFNHLNKKKTNKQTIKNKNKNKKQKTKKKTSTYFKVTIMAA